MIFLIINFILYRYINMSKFFSRMVGTKKEMFFVLMKIIEIDIPTKEIVNKVQIEWKRGNKKSVTK